MDGRRPGLAAWAITLMLLALTGTAVGGAAELALYVAPCLLLMTLLHAGRYLGEERIVRRWGAAVPRPARRERRRWAPSRPAPLAAIAVGAPRARRGPPRTLALAA